MRGKVRSATIEAWLLMILENLTDTGGISLWAVKEAVGNVGAVHPKNLLKIASH
jgi:hypothetical protein